MTWGIHYLLHTNEWRITFGEQGCRLNTEASATRNVVCLGNRRFLLDTGVALAKGGGQVVFDDASSGVIRYLGGGVHCLIRGGRGCSSFETGSSEFYETAGEDTT